MSSSGAQNFPDYFLDEIRSLIRVSELVGRDVELRPEGGELKGFSPFNAENSPSFKVNDRKRFWHDFSSQTSGDVFKWLMLRHGLTFVQAVEQLAREAGLDPIRIDVDPTQAVNGSDHRPQKEKPKPEVAMNGHSKPEPKPKPTVVTEWKHTATYRYTDRLGVLIYFVKRWERLEDGEHAKKFSQHRPMPGHPGEYGRSISAGVYRRGSDGEWFVIDREDETRDGDQLLEACPPSLYRLPELIEAIAQGETVILAEGEKDVETLVRLGFKATTNSSGGGTWRDVHTPLFNGADLILAVDNDKGGHNRRDRLLSVFNAVAKCVRVLDIAQHWSECPKGGDVTDWVDQAGGTAEQLTGILSKLQPVRPPFKSELGFLTWDEIRQKADDPHEYLIEDWLTAREVTVMAGHSQAGKSFFAIDMVMCIARGERFLGKHAVRQGLVLYQAGEGARGLRDLRLPAYIIDKEIKASDFVPIFLLPKSINLFEGETQANFLIKDAQSAEVATGLKCQIIVIDTITTAVPGADENNGKDMQPVLLRCKRIADEVRCAVLLITHLNAGGTKIRGWTGIGANVETGIICTETEERDVNNRKIREAQIQKQKDGDKPEPYRFVLRGVKIGVKSDGFTPLTSCVIDKPAIGLSREDEAKQDFERMNLSDQCILYFTSIQDAIDRYGQPPPKELDHKLPINMRVVDMKYVREIFDSKWTGEGDGFDARMVNQRQARKRHGAKLQVLGVIGVSTPWIWLTGKRVGTNKVKPDATANHAKYHAQSHADCLPSYDEAPF